MDESEYYRREAQRLASRLEEIKSSWSYRLSAPIRLIERLVKSAGKRSFRANVEKFRYSLARGEFRRSRTARDDMRYGEWIASFDTLRASDEELIRQDLEQWPRQPRITVVVLMSFADWNAAHASFESLDRQLYRSFEIIVAGNGAEKAHSSLRNLADISCRIVTERSSPAASYNAALAAATGEMVVAIEVGDTLAPHALYVVARGAVAHPNALIFYSDSDELGPNRRRTNPFFKPDWNPELSLSFNYIGNSAFIRTNAVRAVGGASPDSADAWYWDLVLRIADGAGPADRRRPAVIHLPMVLHHEGLARSHRRQREITAGEPVVRKALARRHRHATLRADKRGWFVIKPELPKPPPHVTIIIPTRNSCSLLTTCVDGVLTRTAYPSFDVTIVDNRSDDAETLAYLRRIEQDPRVTVVPYPEDFNYAKLHNDVVPMAKGELIALLNNDMDVINPDWLAIMAGYAVDPEIGAVGAKLYYPDNRIQHAGVVVGLGGTAGHLFCGLEKSAVGPHGLAMVTQDLSAVTAACLVMRRAVFLDLGGMSQDFAVDYNDIDLCMRLGERGYRIVWAANAEFFHHESATRGHYHVTPDTPERRNSFERHLREAKLFQARWPDIVENDPLYNPNLTLFATNRSLGFPPRRSADWRRLVQLDRPSTVATSTVPESQSTSPSALPISKSLPATSVLE